MMTSKNSPLANSLLPVEIVLHPSWWHAHAGITFDEDFFYHPAKRVESERRMESVLYDRFGKHGLGADRGRDRPVRQTLISQSHNAGSAKVGPAALPIRKAAGIPDDGMAHSLRDGAWKLVFNPQNEVVALFDLAADLSETNNLANAPEQSTRIDRMVKLYAEIRQSQCSSPTAMNNENKME